MRITWYGHAAFLIETGDLRIILDPYRSPDCGGYEPIDETADVVVVSHENDRYHSHLGQIIPPFQVIRALDMPDEGQEFRGVTFEAVHVYENDLRLSEDEVTIIHFHAEDLHVVFLGDLGHALTEDEVDPLRGADIVLIAAGGKPTIDFADIPPLLDEIGPSLIIPMHYLTPKIDLDIQPVERFLECLPDVPVDRVGRTSIQVSCNSLPSEPRIILLNHAR